MKTNKLSIEPLESRDLCAVASLVGCALIVEGDPTGQLIRIEEYPAPGASEVWVDGTMIASVPTADVCRFEVRGNGGRDVVEIEQDDRGWGLGYCADEHSFTRQFWGLASRWYVPTLEIAVNRPLTVFPRYAAHQTSAGTMVVSVSDPTDLEPGESGFWDDDEADMRCNDNAGGTFDGGEERRRRRRHRR